ncbi:tail fiber protein, partial [Yersinia enterocolitica]|nr:tail fiber protein [Yersinia enterocolitica]
KHLITLGIPDLKDASLIQKGIVQLSSSTTSVSEILAATPKAVKDMGDNALKTTNNLSEIAAAGSVAQATTQANIGLTPSKFSGRLLNTQTFTSTGTYTPTTGTAYIEVEAVGGGGASGSLSATGAGQGGITVPGSNGAYAFASFTTGFSSGVSVVIGSGGVGIFGNGPAGGSTAFGTLLSCPGGPGSFVSLAITPPGYTSPQPGPAIPTVTGGTLIKSGYGSLLNPAVILAPGVFTNYRLTTQTPIGTFGLGAGGQISNASAVALIGASGSSGYLIVREYS